VVPHSMPTGATSLGAAMAARAALKP